MRISDRWDERHNQLSSAVWALVKTRLPFSPVDLTLIKVHNKTLETTESPQTAHSAFNYITLTTTPMLNWGEKKEPNKRTTSFDSSTIM